MMNEQSPAPKAAPEMNERPTPETDTLLTHLGFATINADLLETARELERERDDAREDVWAGIEALRRVTKERDEAREQLAAALAAVRDAEIIVRMHANNHETQWHHEHAAIIEIVRKEKVNA